MDSLDAVLDLSVKLALIKRSVNYAPRHTENDAEHSYQLALASWHLNTLYKLQLDEEEILKLALVHDLLEVYAGDVDAHGSKKKIAQKKFNEERALLQMKKDYKMLPEIIEAIEKYEGKCSLEATLVYVVDKLIPTYHVYQNRESANYYRKRKVSLEGWLKWLYAKIDYGSLDKRIKKIVDDRVKIITTEYTEIFYI